MSKNKYYAVKNGRKTGIFLSWRECQEQINQYPNQKFKAFETLEEAEAYLHDKPIVDIEEVKDFTCYAYVKGIFSATKKSYAWRVAVYCHGKLRASLCGCGKAHLETNLKHIEGEIVATKEAVDWAIGRVQELVICYEFNGIEKWIVDRWHTNNAISTDYVKYIDEKMKLIDIKFKKVKNTTTGIITAKELAQKGLFPLDKEND